MADLVKVPASLLTHVRLTRFKGLTIRLNPTLHKGCRLSHGPKGGHKLSDFFWKPDLQQRMWVHALLV
jgi:hypothetical protein